MADCRTISTLPALVAPSQGFISGLVLSMPQSCFRTSHLLDARHYLEKDAELGFEGWAGLGEECSVLGSEGARGPAIVTLGTVSFALRSWSKGHLQKMQ